MRLKHALHGLVLAALVLGTAVARADVSPVGEGEGKIKITKLSDLPPHQYTITGKPSVMVQDKPTVLKLAAEVETDIKKDLDRYDIDDKTAVRRFYGTLLEISMLREDYKEALKQIDKVRELSEKPALKLTAGLNSEAYIHTMDNPGDNFHTTFQANLGKALNALPYDEVSDILKQTKASAEIVSANLVVGAIQSSVDPAATDGKLSQDLATTIIHGCYTLTFFVPNKADYLAAYSAVLDAHKTVAKPDIWAARDVTLDSSQKLTPVTVGIWDSGVDVSLYKSTLYANTKEIPDNKIDDDKNGYVDDYNGIGWTLHSAYTSTLLFPIQDSIPNYDTYKQYMKGLTDLQANIDSPDASELKKKLSTLSQAQVAPFIEGVNAYSQYAHGTHVTGIAVHGNPAARVLVDRITFDYHMIPEKPTVEQAKKDAASMVASVDYFKKYGVRVVNMSWGGDLASIETALEQNKAGGDPKQRRELARKIYDIQYKALYDAAKGAPDVLFVIAAGNGNNDVNFDEIFPSSFKLPNILVAGAVDQAGDVTSFTSFGKVDVYANGFEVPSFVPGGDEMKLSGTSMAAPNVTNLAAKIWAEYPKLTVVQVKDCIVKGSDEKKSGDKTIYLINPKQSMALAAAPPKM
jgi:subtilisin family serine protease